MLEISGLAGVEAQFRDGDRGHEHIIYKTWQTCSSVWLRWMQLESLLAVVLQIHHVGLSADERQHTHNTVEPRLLLHVPTKKQQLGRPLYSAHLRVSHAALLPCERSGY